MRNAREREGRENLGFLFGIFRDLGKCLVSSYNRSLYSPFPHSTQRLFPTRFLFYARLVAAFEF